MEANLSEKKQPKTTLKAQSVICKEDSMWHIELHLSIKNPLNSCSDNIFMIG